MGARGSIARRARACRAAYALATALVLGAPAAQAFRAPELSDAQKKTLKENFGFSVAKLKGPYTENFCVCPGGEKRPVRSENGALGTGCKEPVFCAAYRAPWAEALGRERLWLANIFSRDLYLWDSFPNHHDLVRGYILENYFTETHPEHKLAQLRAFGGLSGSEFETPAADAFAERYLASPDFSDGQHFLLIYELRKRFAVRGDMAQVQKVRSLAVRVQNVDPRFKPLRDAIHNQLSAGILPELKAFRDELPAGSERAQVDEIVTELAKLTALDETVLAPAGERAPGPGAQDALLGLAPAGGRRRACGDRQSRHAHAQRARDRRGARRKPRRRAAPRGPRRDRLERARAEERCGLRVEAGLDGAAVPRAGARAHRRELRRWAPDTARARRGGRRAGGPAGEGGPAACGLRAHLREGGAHRGVGAGQRAARLRGGLGALDLRPARRGRRHRRHPARLRAAPVRAGRDAPRRLRRRPRTARLLRGADLGGRAGAEPRPRRRPAEGGPGASRLHAQ